MQIFKQKRYTIIYPPTIDWDWMQQRPQRLMETLADAGHKVYYCQNFQQRKGVKPKEIKKNLYLCSDPNLIRDKIDILWIGNPGIQNEWIGKYKEKLVVYDCVDDFYKFWGANEDMLTRKADIVITTSRILYDRKCKQKGEDKVFLVPNGLASSFLETEGEPFLKDIDIYGTKTVKIGYVGALANWFDYDLFFNLTHLFNRVKFILIGVEFHTMPEGIKNGGYSNIAWLGLKPHHVLKYYIDKLDVCIIPFIKNEITEATDPVKLYEYLARGKPVVATRLQTIEENFSEVAYLADGFAEFTEQINLALSQKGGEFAEKRKEWVKTHTWEIRVRQIEEILSKVL